MIPGAYGEATADLGPDLIEAQHGANHETSERVRAIFRNLCGEGAVWQEAEGARGAAMLRRHGRAVHPRQVDRPDGDAGEALLAQAGLQRADLLVVGAYGHARLRELVFGSAPPRPAQRRPARVLRQRAPPLASP